jgi:O-antigen ligase
VAVSPSLGVQTALIMATVVIVATIVLARAGRVLNAAWLIVPAIYLIDPLDALLGTIGINIPMVVIVAVAPLTFVLAAFWAHPARRDRLVMIVPLVLLLAFAGLSLGWSSEPEIGLRKLAVWMLTGFIPCASILVLASHDEPVSWPVVAIAALLYAAVLLAIGTTASIYTGRLVFFDANPIWVARALFVGALVVLFGPFRLRWKLLLVPILLVAGHQTDSLGPTVGLAAGIWVGFAETLRSADRSDRRVQLGWAVLVLTIGVGLAVVFGVIGTAGTYLTSVVNDPNVTSRALFLDVAFRAFLASPLVGNGIGAFAATGLAEYPHNIVLEIAAEMGIVGLACLLGWVVLAFRGAARSPLLLALLVASGTFALFSGSMAGNAEFWLFSGLAVAMTRGSPSLAPAAVASTAAAVVSG